MDLLIAQIAVGITTGALYFFVAAGLTLLWGALDVVNLAHGSFYMLAAFSATTFITELGPGWGLLAALVVVPAIVAVVGIALEVSLFRRVYKYGVWGQLLVSFGLVLVIADLVRTFFGPVARSVQAPDILEGFVSMFGVRVARYEFLILGMSLAVSIGLWYLLARSRTGRLIKAAVDDPDMLSAVGVNVNHLRTRVMGISAALAGLAGVAAAPRSSVSLGSDVNIVIVAFAVIVIGGLGSISGALIAGLVLGIAESVSTIYLDQGSEVVVFAVMVLVLVLRPTGLKTIVGREA